VIAQQSIRRSYISSVILSEDISNHVGVEAAKLPRHKPNLLDIPWCELRRRTGTQPGGMQKNEKRVAARPLKSSNLLIGGSSNIIKVILQYSHTDVFRQTIDDVVSQS